MILQSKLEVVNIGRVNISSVKFSNVHGNTGKQYAKKFKGVEKDGEKTCNKCMKSKLLGEFHTDNNAIDCKSGRCKECVRLFTKNWYAKSVGKTVEDIGIKGKIIDNKKKCPRCLKWKLISGFHKNNILKCGLSSCCKNCISNYGRAYNFRETKRIKLICMMGYGGKCVCCDESKLSLLTIEHIRFKGHKLIYCDTNALMKKLIELGFPKGYTILCWGCNLSTANGMPCIHSKEYKLYVDKYIKPYFYEKQKELDELERKWETMNS